MLVIGGRQSAFCRGVVMEIVEETKSVPMEWQVAEKQEQRQKALKTASGVRPVRSY